MIKRQRMAIWLLVLVCLAVLFCTAQRVKGWHTLVIDPAAMMQSLQQDGDGSCELSTKSLLSASSVFAEELPQVIVLLIVVLTVIALPTLPSTSPFVISAPCLRVHLRLCIFRE